MCSHDMMKMCRHYMGQDLDPLSLRELQSLEQQIDTSIKRIRSRKVRQSYIESELLFLQCHQLISQQVYHLNNMQNQLMHESISELQKKVTTYIYILLVVHNHVIKEYIYILCIQSYIFMIICLISNPSTIYEQEKALQEQNNFITKKVYISCFLEHLKLVAILSIYIYISS